MPAQFPHRFAGVPDGDPSKVRRSTPDSRTLERVPVARVPCVCGDFFYVSIADLSDPSKTLLPLYTRAGRKWADTASGQRAAANNEATHLPRRNIGNPTP